MWTGKAVFFLLLAGVSTLSAAQGLPRRLVVAIDSIAYRDMQALQQGTTYRTRSGDWKFRRAFHDGYFPVCRMVSTFPSASDVAWTTILGDRPLPGYQRTYFRQAEGRMVTLNALNAPVEFEKQMTWRMQGMVRLGLSYVYPMRAYRYEVDELVRSFLNSTNGQPCFYAFIWSSDAAQHMDCDILEMLCILDKTLAQLRTVYRQREGRELEILLVSDHGNNHAGPGNRVEVRSFLRRHGYRISKRIRSERDIALPTVGIQSWVEIHSQPSQTERLLALLPQLPGVDLITGKEPSETTRFVVADRNGHRATIEWRPPDAYRYVPVHGDPLRYEPVVEELRNGAKLDAQGFATGEAWMQATLTHHYPLALERIVFAHSHIALNTATILLSLDNHYVHAGWLVKKGSELSYCAGTHGAMDHLNSVGILLSNFAPAADTSANRVAAAYQGFEGLRDYRAEESGAEWVFPARERLAGVTRTPQLLTLAETNHFLRVWGAALRTPGTSPGLELKIRRLDEYVPPVVRRGGASPPKWQVFQMGKSVCELNGPHDRLYSAPAGLALAPNRSYEAVGTITGTSDPKRAFSFRFRTDAEGNPAGL